MKVWVVQLTDFENNDNSGIWGLYETREDAYADTRKMIMDAYPVDDEPKMDEGFDYGFEETDVGFNGYGLFDIEITEMEVVRVEPATEAAPYRGGPKP